MIQYMIFFFRFLFFNIFNKYLIVIWIVFSPGTALSLGVDGKAIEGVELYQKQMFDQASKRFPTLAIVAINRVTMSKHCRITLDQ